MKNRNNNPQKISALAVAIALTFSCAQVGMDGDAEKAVLAKEEKAKYEKAKAQAAAEKHRQLEIMKKRASTERSLAEASALMAFADTAMHQKEFVSGIAPAPSEIRNERHFADNLYYNNEIVNTEKYQDIEENAVKMVSQMPVSTFSVDVDTGSYTNSRRMLKQGYMPPKDAVRVEEFINYFDYDYKRPDDLSQPFSITTDVATAPWNPERHIMRIGLQGYEKAIENNGKNLVFLIDVSGSMNNINKLPLLKRSLVMLTNQLKETDKVSIVVYAGASGVVLEPTAANDTAKITAALERLGAGGSTNGASGINLAYQLAEQAFIKDGVNRVILATDGDFNVGMVDHNALIELIEKKREKGIALTTLGFGSGNYNDHLMEQLADAGNGNYAYIDTINEARKVLVDELSATMQIIAKDVKVQIEFNPNQVAEYRLIGYENRVLKNEDFNNDKVDAGDIGAGHSVTALYEITLVDSNDKYNDELRYQNDNKVQGNQKSSELAHVKLRFKQPQGDVSELVESTISIQDIVDFEKQSMDFKFATAVAGFAQLVKSSKYVQNINYNWVINTAVASKGDDVFGYRSEFIQLARNASALNAKVELNRLEKESEWTITL